MSKDCEQKLLLPSLEEKSVHDFSNVRDTEGEVTRSTSLSDIIAEIELNRYHITTMITVFVGYSARHALLDMAPVLSTRLYVEMDLTPEMESALATVTFIGMTISYLLTGWIANKFGRKKCVVWGTVWTLFWNALSAVAWNMQSLIVFRFMWSFGACKFSLLSFAVFAIPFVCQ